MARARQYRRPAGNLRITIKRDAQASAAALAPKHPRTEAVLARGGSTREYFEALAADQAAAEQWRIERT